MTKEEKLQTEVITTEQAIYCMNHQYNYEKYECDDCPYCDVCEEKGIEGRMIKRAVIALKTIRDLPSVTPKQEWIPCSERLPEEKVEVLVTTECGNITIAERYSANDYFINDGAASVDEDEITAWMPLPKPYEGDKKDD